MNPPKIMVTGANGQLGRELREIAIDYPEYDFVFGSREDLPIQHEERVQQVFEAEKPQFCINCAAYTAVDKAESDQETAFMINGEGAGILASVCKQFNTRFIHISTDYVFNGKATYPYKVDQQVEPVNTYGASKLMGENLAMQNNPDSIIVRTSWVYSPFGGNFVKTMLRLMRERKTLNVVDDQHGSPTYAADLADALVKIIQSGKWLPGIYHYSNQGAITWHTFAEAIKEAAYPECQIIPIPTSNFPTPAKRPGYSVLDTSKLIKEYGIQPPDWKVGLEKCLTRMTLE